MNILLFRATSEKGPETAPLTIFYKGTVSIFNVPRDKVRLNIICLIRIFKNRKCNYPNEEKIL